MLYPLKLVPAMLLGHRPELMTNLIVSLHLALFALGGWFLATTVRAPVWAGVVAAFSFGFCGVQFVDRETLKALSCLTHFCPGCWVE